MSSNPAIAVQVSGRDGRVRSARREARQAVRPEAHEGRPEWPRVSFDLNETSFILIVHTAGHGSRAP